MLLQAIQKYFGEGFFTLGFGIRLLLVEALEVGAGDLQAVEHEGGGAVVDGLIGETANDLHDGVLQAGGVLDHGQGVVGAFLVGGDVEAAEAASFEGGLAAGLIVEPDVAAKRSVSESFRKHEVPIPPPWGSMWNQQVMQGIPWGPLRAIGYLLSVVSFQQEKLRAALWAALRAHFFFYNLTKMAWKKM